MVRRLFHIPSIAILFLCLNVHQAAAQAASVAGATTAVSTAAAATGLDVFAAYGGSWQSDVQFQATPYGKGYEAKYQLRNDCWRSAGYYVCHQFVDGASKALLVFMYDPQKGYSIYPIPVEGASDVHPGRLLIEGKVWTFPWEVKQAGKTTYFHVINTWTSGDSIEFRQEYSEDGKHWQPMAQGHEVRVKG